MRSVPGDDECTSVPGTNRCRGTRVAEEWRGEGRLTCPGSRPGSRIGSGQSRPSGPSGPSASCKPRGDASAAIQCVGRGSPRRCIRGDQRREGSKPASARTDCGKGAGRQRCAAWCAAATTIPTAASYSCSRDAPHRVLQRVGPWWRNVPMVVPMVAGGTVHICPHGLCDATAPAVGILHTRGCSVWGRGG